MGLVTHVVYAALLPMAPAVYIMLSLYVSRKWWRWLSRDGEGRLLLLCGACVARSQTRSRALGEAADRRVDVAHHE